MGLGYPSQPPHPYHTPSDLVVGGPPGPYHTSYDLVAEGATTLCTYDNHAPLRRYDHQTPLGKYDRQTPMAVAVTVARYATPSGGDLNGKGVAPDRVVACGVAERAQACAGR